MIDFKSTGTPRMHLFIGDPGQACNIAWKISSELGHAYEVKVFQGSRMRTKAGLFQEFAAALQFPYYFGNNWDALHDCLEDLQWLPADGYVLFLSDSAQLLAEDHNAVTILLQVLAQAAEYWATPMTAEHKEVRNRQAKPFHVVFNCLSEQETAMRDKLSCFPYSRSEFPLKNQLDH